MSTAYPVIGRAKRISSLDAAGALDGTEAVAVVQAGSTRRATLNAIRLPTSGATAARPTLTSSDIGFQYYDTTLGLPVWWSGSAWKTAAGGVV